MAKTTAGARKKQQEETGKDLNFFDLLRLLTTESGKSYSIPYMGEEVISGDLLVYPGDDAYFGTKGSLQLICGITRPSLHNVLTWYNLNDKDQPALRPAFFVNLAEALLILDELGNPLINPANGKAIVFRGFQHPTTDEFIPPWLQLQLLYYRDAYAPEEYFSSFINNYYEQPIKNNIEKINKSTTETSVVSSNISELQLDPQLEELLTKVSPDVATQMLQLLRGTTLNDSKNSKLAEMLLRGMQACRCSTPEEFASYLYGGEEEGPGFTKAVTLINKILRGEAVDVKKGDPLSVLVLLARHLTDDEGNSFGGDVDRMLTYARLGNGTPSH